MSIKLTRSEYIKQRRLKIKLETIEKMGNKCTCCGESEPEFLTIDHINGGGNIDRKKGSRMNGNSWRNVQLLGYPKDLQLMCFNCNYSKYFGNGICWHKRDKNEQ